VKSAYVLALSTPYLPTSLLPYQKGVIMFEGQWGRMFARWRRVIERQIIGSEEQNPDPEQLLQQAQEEMRAVHAKNRERAVQAITQKNNLQQMVQDTQRKVETLRAKAVEEEQRGKHGMATQLRVEADRYAETLEMTRHQLEQAIETAEAVKAAIKAEEERIRQKTAEALALRAQWKSVQIEQTIARRLAEINAGVTGKSPAELRAQHEWNREALVEAIKVRDQLKQMVEDTARKVAEIKVKAGFARQRGDKALEWQLLREMEQHETTLLATREALDRAEMMTDRAMVMLREEETTLAHLPPMPAGEDASTPVGGSAWGPRDPTIPALALALGLVLLLLLLWVLLLV
jgi:phage shock protein A